MARRHEIGQMRVWCRGDGASWTLHPDGYDGLRSAWMRGESFWTGADLYGAMVTVKLGEVVAVGRCSPESVAEHEADDKEDALGVTA